MQRLQSVLQRSNYQHAFKVSKMRLLLNFFSTELHLILKNSDSVSEEIIFFMKLFLFDLFSTLSHIKASLHRKAWVWFYCNLTLVTAIMIRLAFRGSDVNYLAERKHINWTIPLLLPVINLVLPTINLHINFSLFFNHVSPDVSPKNLCY